MRRTYNVFFTLLALACIVTAIALAARWLFLDSFSTLDRQSLQADLAGEAAANRFLLLFSGLILLLGGALAFAYNRLTRSLRKQQEVDLLYHSLVDRAAEGIVLANQHDLRIIEANASFSNLTGRDHKELLSCTLYDIFTGDKAELAEEFERILHQSRDLTITTLDEQTVYTEVSGSVIRIEENDVLSLILHNVTERKNFELQLMHQAHHDPLTGLPNRLLLYDRLLHSLATAARKKHTLCVMLLDLDNFKNINDTLGHTFGDQLLISVTKRLKTLVRASDTIARIGGDEFVIILSQISGSEDAVTISRRYLEELSRPFTVHENEIHLSASIGIAQYPDDGSEPETLFKKADTAMYHVKARGRNGIQFFTEELNIRVSRRLALESRLRHAIAQNELSLNFQPQIDLATGRIVGMEALLRWTSSELGPVSPGDFIHVAEETGLIVPIGAWALREACIQHRKWEDEGLPPLRMAVNLSPRQFAEKDLVGMVQTVIDETGITPSLLDLEVTESLMMNNVNDSISKMESLKALGISLSIDDFGTGYSSLSCLHMFPLDMLKIDRSFVLEIGKGDKSVIIRAIVAMAHSLGLTVVAEGVETHEQLAFLKSHRCEEVQGFYFSRPLSAEKFSTLIKTTMDRHPDVIPEEEEPGLFNDEERELPLLELAL